MTPWTAACQASLSITKSQSLLKFMSIESVIPSKHFILCHPLLLLPSSFLSIRVFSSESALRIRWPKYWSFSFNISPSNEYSGLIPFRMDWFDHSCSPASSLHFAQSSTHTPFGHPVLQSHWLCRDLETAGLGTALLTSTVGTEGPALSIVRAGFQCVCEVAAPGGPRTELGCSKAWGTDGGIKARPAWNGSP